MIDRLKNPLDLVICLKMLNVISLSDHESEKRIDKIVSKHLGDRHGEYSKQANQQLINLTDGQKVKLTRECLDRLQGEEDAAKKEKTSNQNVNKKDVDRWTNPQINATECGEIKIVRP